MNEQITFILTILLLSVVLAIAIYFFQQAYMKKVIREDKDNIQEDLKNVGFTQGNTTKIDFGVWEGVKFGLGFGIGIVLAGVVIWLVSMLSLAVFGHMLFLDFGQTPHMLR